MKKQNIGIITFHRAHNYGAILQAIALQTILERKYNVFFLDFYNRITYDVYKPFKPVGKSIKKWPIRILRSIKHYRVRKKKYILYNCFIEKELNIRKFDGKNINICDVLITGSDQVWNTKLTGGLLDEYTLNFGKKESKRLSYAASCGSIDIINNNREDFSKKLKNIDYISIREESNKEILQTLLSKQIDIVLDPTLLLTKSDWDELLSQEKNIVEEKYILVYVVQQNEELVKIANDLSNKTGLKIITLSNIKNLINKYQTDYIFNPYEFVNLIKNAEYVITTSFHATVFSIIYNKKFLVVPHKETGSRVTDLLRNIGLYNHAIYSYNGFRKEELDEPVKWEIVNKKIKLERKKSLEWLKKSIES